MTKVALTEEKIAAHEYQGGTDYLWDTERAGFGIRTYPSGSQRYVYLIDGQAKVLGPVDGWSLKEAWLTARRRQQKTAMEAVGIPQPDPPAALTTDREHRTVKDLATRHVEWVEAHRKESYAEDVERRYRLVIVPEWGEMLLRALSPETVEIWHGQQKHRPVYANRALATLRAGWNLAARWGWVEEEDNPCRYLRHFKHAEKPRTRIADEEERKLLLEAMSTVERRPKYWLEVQAIRLIAMTGMRYSEVMAMRWEETDLEKGYVRLLDHKTSRSKGPKTVALPERVCSLLEEIGIEAAGPIFEFAHDNRIRYVWKRVRKVAGIEDITIHDLRRTYATLLFTKAGVPIDGIAKMLGQSTVRVAADHYIHPDLEYRQKISEEGSDLVF